MVPYQGGIERYCPVTPPKDDNTNLEFQIRRAEEEVRQFNH
jgi:hypothetical protein